MSQEATNKHAIREFTRIYHLKKIIEHWAEIAMMGLLRQTRVLPQIG